jgi:formate hydrogenlyase subunit 3/multisubunit Na+/H+ antiporter MnhD subunit
MLSQQTRLHTGHTETNLVILLYYNNISFLVIVITFTFGIYSYVYTPAYTGDDRGYTGMFIHLLILGMTGDIQVCLYTCLYWG